jgi:outer membrane protein assembly factor BamA
VLNLRLQPVEGTDSVVAVGTEGYIPAGGLARASFATELRLPFPGLGESWGTHVFFDGGRVWTPDSRLRRDDANDEERWFYSTGGGVDVNTIVGPIRLTVGYKLNPSVLDVRRARAVFEALAQGLPASSVAPDGSKRWHFHLSLGQTF